MRQGRPLLWLAGPALWSSHAAVDIKLRTAGCTCSSFGWCGPCRRRRRDEGDDGGNMAWGKPGEQVGRGMSRLLVSVRPSMPMNINAHFCLFRRRRRHLTRRWSPSLGCRAPWRRRPTASSEARQGEAACRVSFGGRHKPKGQAAAAGQGHIHSCVGAAVGAAAPRLLTVAMSCLPLLIPLQWSGAGAPGASRGTQAHCTLAPVRVQEWRAIWRSAAHPQVRGLAQHMLLQLWHGLVRGRLLFCGSGWRPHGLILLSVVPCVSAG